MAYSEQLNRMIVWLRYGRKQQLVSDEVAVRGDLGGLGCVILQGLAGPDFVGPGLGHRPRGRMLRHSRSDRPEKLLDNYLTKLDGAHANRLNAREIRADGLLDMSS